ncbi:MAG: NFACT family protein [Clostridiales bacterium]|nr:NFACT family protein [Clostridiales bacterium]
MNYSAKSGIKTFNKILFAILILLIIALVLIVCVFFKGGSVKTVTQEVGAVEASASVEFQSGTYGGVQFDSIEDVVNYYVTAYNATKAETANYIDEDGNTVTFYAMLGDEDLQIVGDVLVDGKTNSIIDSIVPGVINTLFSGNVYGLPPCSNRNPDLDTDENEESLMTSRLTADDIVSASVSENSDGTITLVMQPQACEMSHKGLDSQGKMFNVLGAIDETVESISVLSWASGTTADNCKVTYENGTATVTIDPETGKITQADYEMLVTVDVTHANVSVIKDKSATLQLSYTQHFPASDEYLMTSRNLTRA